MTVWTLVQVVFDLCMLVGVAALALRLRRPPQDDPRLSRGLQLLQTKITVLEDLSDRTDAQVKQLTSLLDQKTRMLQNKVLEAEQQIMKIDHSMEKSREVAEIFQDKIPHNEILERQRTVEYVKAARMAHSGLSIDEIAQNVHLPREQVELIAKFNRDQLMFDETQLPDWAKRSTGLEPSMNSFGINEMDFVGGREKPTPDLNQMAKIETEFKKAIETAKHNDILAQQSIMDSKVAETLKAGVNTGMETMQPAVMTLKATAQTLKEKLVSTAEDLLRSQQAGMTVAAAMKAQQQQQQATLAAAPGNSKMVAQALESKPTVTKIAGDSPQVKKVIFPRIEKM